MMLNRLSVIFLLFTVTACAPGLEDDSSVESALAGTPRLHGKSSASSAAALRLTLARPQGFTPGDALLAVIATRGAPAVTRPRVGPPRAPTIWARP